MPSFQAEGVDATVSCEVSRWRDPHRKRGGGTEEPGGRSSGSARVGLEPPTGLNVRALPTELCRKQAARASIPQTATAYFGAPADAVGREDVQAAPSVTRFNSRYSRLDG